MADTASLVKFRSLVGLSGELLGLESRYSDPPRPEELDVVNGLRGGAAVLMVAAFEAYLKNGVSEMLAVLNAPPVRSLITLPKSVQVASIFGSLEHAMRGPRYSLGGAKVDRLVDVVAAVNRIAAGNVDADALSQTKSNPGPDTVERLLKSVGLKNPFSAIRGTFDAKWGKPEAVKFVADKLQEIVVRRHRVAHSADASGISRDDVNTAKKFLLVLAETIDFELQRHVASL